MNALCQSLPCVAHCPLNFQAGFRAVITAMEWYSQVSLFRAETPPPSSPPTAIAAQAQSAQYCMMYVSRFVCMSNARWVTSSSSHPICLSLPLSPSFSLVVTKRGGSVYAKGSSRNVTVMVCCEYSCRHAQAQSHSAPASGPSAQSQRLCRRKSKKEGSSSHDEWIRSAAGRSSASQVQRQRHDLSAQPELDSPRLAFPPIFRPCPR